MKTTPARHVRRAALFAVSAIGVAATVITAGTGSAVASPASGGANPVAETRRLRRIGQAVDQFLDTIGD
jgi:hypothetical protein